MYLFVNLTIPLAIFTTILNSPLSNHLNHFGNWVLACSKLFLYWRGNSLSISYRIIWRWSKFSFTWKQYSRDFRSHVICSIQPKGAAFSFASLLLSDSGSDWAKFTLDDHAFLRIKYKKNYSFALVGLPGDLVFPGDLLGDLKPGDCFGDFLFGLK